MAIRKLFEWIGSCLEVVFVVEKTPLKNFGFHRAHMVFQALAFMWALIFGWIVGNWMLFGIASFIHVMLIGGLMVTLYMWRLAYRLPRPIDRYREKLKSIDENK